MKAIILTAGYGRRMQPLTCHTHKTLLSIENRAVIQWIVDALLVQQITDIVIVTGYRAADLQAFLADTYPELDIRYIHNVRYAETNNIYSLALAFEQIEIDDDLLLIESDLIFKPEALARLLDSSYPNAALVDSYRSGMDGTVVALSEQNVITEVIPPHLQGEDFDFGDKYKTLNIYRFSQEFCATTFKRLLTYYAKVIDDNCYYELILGIIIYMQREVIHAVILDGEAWAEIDDPNDLRIAEFQFTPSRRKMVLEQAFGGYWNYDILDFCFLRNMYFPTSAVLSELRNNLSALVQNYGSNQSILNEKLAWYLKCRKERVSVLNGLSQIYPLLKRYLKGKTCLRPEPTFGEYARIVPDADTYPDQVGIELNSIDEHAQSCDVFIVVNPNNPTGTTISTSWIYELAQRYPQNIVIVDESFIEFSSETSLLSLLEEHPLDNMILLKSLSKSLGVPGLRLGYVYTSHADFHQALTRDIPIWNLNSLAEYFLEIILKFRPEVQASFHHTIRDRDAFAAQLHTMPLIEQVYPSGGNFLLVSLACSPEESQQMTETLLLRDNIYVKDVSSRFRDAKAYWRIAVRLPEENQRFVSCFSVIADETTGIAYRKE